MTYFINIETLEYPLHDDDIRLRYPRMGKDFVLPEGYAQVEEVSPPVCTSPQEYYYPLAPVFESGGWKQQWAIGVMSQEEYDARQAALLESQMIHNNRTRQQVPE